MLHDTVSHPMRVRGLKLTIIVNLRLYMLSHPMRVRGLKLALTVELHLGEGRTPCGCVD